MQIFVIVALFCSCKSSLIAFGLEDWTSFFAAPTSKVLAHLIGCIAVFLVVRVVFSVTALQVDQMNRLETKD
jgi:hypothetical protein